LNAEEAPDDSRAEPFRPSDHDCAALVRYKQRKKQQAPAPRFTVEYKGDAVHIHVDHPGPDYGYARLSDMLATGDMTLAGGLLEQLADVARVGKRLTERQLNMMLATVAGISPRDPTETLLACQMAAVHNATMMAARRLNHVENLAQQDSASNMLNKLSRTFAAQIEALKRYRSSGEQNVRVTHQHVSVSANQAVVGIHHGGGGIHENASQSHALEATDATSDANASSATLLSEEQKIPMSLQGPSCERQQCVPHARCESRGAKGKS
jgi:hypothetical protein